MVSATHCRRDGSISAERGPQISTGLIPSDVGVVASTAALASARTVEHPSIRRLAPRWCERRPLLGDRPGALATGDALASDAQLQLVQLGLATHVDPLLPGSNSAVVGTLHDTLAFVLSQGDTEPAHADLNTIGQSSGAPRGRDGLLLQPLGRAGA